MGILEILGRDSSVRPNQISSGLAEKNILLTPRSVLNRIKKLREAWNHTRLHVEIKPNFI